MRRLSDTTLRRVAWVALGLFVAALASKVLVFLGDRTGSGNLTDFRAVGQVALYVVIASLPVTAVVILRRQPRNRIGWLLMVIAWVWGVGLLADNYARYGLLVNPGAVPGADVAAAVNAAIWAPGLGLMGTFLILVFPDGRLPSPRWRPLAWLSGITIVGLTVTLELTPGKLEVGAAPQLQNPLGLESAQPVLDPAVAVFFALFPLCIVLSAVALVLRFRRSSGVERLQLKWLATAGTIVALTFLGSLVASLLQGALTSSNEESAWLTVLDSLSLTSFMLLPVAIGTALVRHQLYDIDVVINRTLVYGSLSLTLAAMYVGSVLLLQTVLNPLTRDSELAVAGSTLVVAALFRPLRTRIQSVVDRRFYRSRYDAARTLDAFTARVRNDVDVESVGADLRATVAETVHPSHLSLWLRP